MRSVEGNVRRKQIFISNERAPKKPNFTPITPKNFIYSDHADPQDPEQILINKQLSEKFRKILDESLNTRELKIMKLREEGLNYEEIATKYGITRSRVGQIIKAIKIRLRKNPEMDSYM